MKGRTREEERQYRAEYRKRVYLQREPAMVDAIGTRRRLQALMAAGWSGPELSRRVGRSRSWAGDSMVNRKVTRVKRELVKRLYDELWDKTPPMETSMQRHDAAYAQMAARRNGWLPPAAWDDDSIDDRNAAPARVYEENVIDYVAVKRAMDGRDVELTPAELDAAIAALLRQGVTQTGITKRFAVGKDRVKRINRQRKVAA